MEITAFLNNEKPVLISINKTFHALAIVFFINAILCVGKLVTGFVVNSFAMVADGFHSLFDVAANVVCLLSLIIASKPPDADHPCGHRKFEVLAALGIAVIMGVTCLEILESAFHKLQHVVITPSPNASSYFVMIFTMTANSWCAWYEGKKAKVYQSSILEADSSLTFSDILLSASVMVSLICAHFGFGWVNLLASGFVALVVGWAAWKIVEKAVWVLSDRAILDPGIVASMVRSITGIISCNKIRSRGMQGNIFIDLHVQVSPKLTTLKSHALTHQGMTTVKDAIDGVKEVYVHTRACQDWEKHPLKGKITWKSYQLIKKH